MPSASTEETWSINTSARKAPEVNNAGHAATVWRSKFSLSAKAAGRSANPGIKIMLGGFLVQQRPDLVHVLGADFSANAADEAVRLAERWLAMN